MAVPTDIGRGEDMVRSTAATSIGTAAWLIWQKRTTNAEKAAETSPQAPVLLRRFYGSTGLATAYFGLADSAYFTTSASLVASFCLQSFWQ